MQHRAVFKTYCVLAVGVITASCGMLSTQVEQALVWPAPPAPPRIQYVATLRSQSSFDLQTPAERVVRWLKGDDDSVGPSVFQKPYDVAANAGLVVVTDTLAGRVQVFDLARRKVFAIGWRGDGQLLKPSGVAVTDDGTIYVSDLGQRVVWVYDRMGHYVRELGRNAGLVRPVDVAVTAHGEYIYVVDAGGVDSLQHRVVRLDAEGAVRGELGTRGTGPGEFNLPTQAAVGPDGSLYVLDSGNFRVQVFDADGKWLRQFGAPGDQPGDFARARGLAVDALGQIYVSDAAFQNVQIFNAVGEWLLTFGEPGVGPGRFLLPAGVACDAQAGIYVVDQLHARVDVFRRF
ncbi:MAG: 6-bladed beta-propeller [Pseudomonadota bacterium]